MIAAPPPPPAIVQPASYQVSYGLVSGMAAPGTRRVIVRAGGRVLADLPLRGRRFELHVSLPARETSVYVVTRRADGSASSRRVDHVFGLPRAAAPRLRTARLDQLLQPAIRRLAQGFGPTSAIYVQNVVTGQGAAWNARASFPGASALKLGVAVAALARTDGTPTPGSTLDGLLRRMLIVSDNEAANAAERYVGGSTSGGSAAVNELMRSIGLVDTEMYGGYETDAVGAGTRVLATGIPWQVDSQPTWGVGKRTTAYDLAGLLRAVWLASAGKGPLHVAQPRFTGSDARYLLYLLAHVADHGKADREVGRIAAVTVLHKAGWIDSARHENALVLWPGGAIVVTVMTYRPGGAGTSSDILAGQVASAALRRYRG